MGLLRYVKTLIFVDFVVCALGAFAGINAYFWFATIHCGR